MKIDSIDLIWIVVADLQQALKFYTETMGLKLMELSEEHGWAELQGHEGGARLGIAQSCKEKGPKPGENAFMTFSLGNVSKKKAELEKKGVQCPGSIEEIPGHVKMQMVTDPDGNSFQIVEKLWLDKTENKANKENKPALFSHMIFYVKDIPMTLSFYEKAFGLSQKFVHESGQYAELATGDVALAFVSESLAESNLPEGYLPHNPKKLPFGCEIAFTVEDVNVAYKKAVASGATALAPPREKPWGQTLGYVRDPNGILIEIANPCTG